MNLKKILAGAAAAALAATSLVMPASAAADTSTWVVAACAFTADWQGWKFIESEPDVLTLETTVGDLKAKDNIADDNFGGINVQSWGGPVGAEIEYTVTIGTAVSDSGKAAYEQGDGNTAAFLGQYQTSLAWGNYEFNDSDAIVVTIVPVDDGTDEPETTTEFEATEPEETEPEETEPAGTETVDSNDTTAAPDRGVEAIGYEAFDTYLAVGNSADWTTAYSSKVAFTGTGTYTYSLTDLSIDPDALTVIYVKDVYAEEGGDSSYKTPVSPIAVTYDSVKINGVELAVAEGAPDGLNNNGIFDVCLYNIWGDSFIELSADTITSVEITLSVAAAAEDTTAPADDVAPATSYPDVTPDGNKDDTSNSGDNGTDNTDAGTDYVSDNTGNTDTNSGSTTGNKGGNPATGVVLVTLPLIAATAGVVISKKRK